MIQAKLSDIVTCLSAQRLGEDNLFEGVSIDTRTLPAQALYVAIKGEQFDGHDFIRQAAEKGAAAVLCERVYPLDIPQLVVHDTRLALGQLAHWYRQQFSIPFLALTGSCGKTTTKTLLASILRQCGKVHATVGTLNNDYGLPLTLLSLSKDDEFAVIEMGANHLEEISYLSAITNPDVALITNAGAVHLEGFGSLDRVGQAKGEIFQHLSPEGVAIINADDAFAAYWMSLIKNQKILTFSQTQTADVYATDLNIDEQDKPHFVLHYGKETAQIQLPLIGEQNVANALAASAAALAVKAPLTAVVAGLEQAKSEAKRLNEHHAKSGAYIIDDTYNANPVAMALAFKLLARKKGKKIIIMGDMSELGEKSVFYHESMGQLAKELGIDYLFAFGDLSRHSVAAFGEQGQFFTDKQILLEKLTPLLNKNSFVLVKGSRRMRMEEIVQALL